MTDEKKPMKITFAPGCFDNFDGTQEELDALMVQIQDMFDSGEAQVQAVSVEDLLDEFTEEELLEIFQQDTDEPKTLH